MTTPTFKTGQIVYDKNRNAGYYAHSIEEGHVVYPRESDEWGDELVLPPVIWAETFAEQPKREWSGWVIAVVIVVGFWWYVFS